MFWSISWLVTGALAFLLVLINLIRAAVRKNRGWQIFLFTSLSCGALSMLCAFQMVYDEVREGDWSALMDVVPTQAAILSGAAALGIALNLIALWVNLRAERKSGVENNE